MDFSKLELSYQWRNQQKPAAHKPIIGLDTEAYVNGKAFLLTDSTGGYSFGNDNFIQWLMQKRFQESTNFFYNIDYDVIAILKNVLDKQHFRDLYKLHKCDVGDCSLKYIPRKFFCIRQGNHVSNFYDLWQYFHMALDSASKKYLKAEKLEMETKEFSKEYVMQNRERILQYCIKDSQLCAGLGNYMDSCFNPLGGVGKPISNAYISEMYFKSHVQFPNFLKIPREVLAAAWQAYHGGRFEVIKRGCMSHISCYDINSAYPYQYLSLVDYTKGRWHKSLIPQQRGFYQAKIKFQKEFIYPHPAKSGNIIVYPQNVEGWITGKELCHYIDSGLCEELEIKKGYSWEGCEEYPLADCVKFLYSERQKSEAAKYAIKIILNSIYGKFIQKTKMLKLSDYNDFDYYDFAANKYYKEVWKTGQLFNPCWAAEITAGARLQLYDAAIKYDAVAMATDSILTEKHMPDSSGLGGWKAERVNEDAIIIGSGLYQLGNSGNYVSKHRGIYTKTDLKTLLENSANLPNISVMMRKVQKLGQSLNAVHKMRFEDVNTFQSQIKKVNINFDMKRIWQGEWKKCGDVFNELHESEAPPSA